MVPGPVYFLRPQDVQCGVAFAPNPTRGSLSLQAPTGTSFRMAFLLLSTPPLRKSVSSPSWSCPRRTARVQPVQIGIGDLALLLLLLLLLMAPPSKPRRRTRRTERSLCCFVMAMRGMVVVVERTDDALVRGTLDFVDEGVKCVSEIHPIRVPGLRPGRC